MDWVGEVRTDWCWCDDDGLAAPRRMYDTMLYNSDRQPITDTDIYTIYSHSLSHSLWLVKEVVLDNDTVPKPNFDFIFL
jgi:hypothetical protein